MPSLALGLLAVALAGSQYNIPADMNLDHRGEAGYLWSGYTKADPGQPIAWQPREGDLVFMTSPDPGQTIAYSLARTWHPFHSGIVIKRSNGELALLESGGAKDYRVSLSPILGRLNRDDMVAERRFTWIRRYRGVITPQQSATLTAFGEAQVGKPFVRYSRLAWFWLPFHPAPKPTTVDQERWFCSEIVAAALHQAGIIPEHMFPPGSTMPRNMFMDCFCKDISDIYHAPLPWSMYFSAPPVPGPNHAPYRARE